MTDINFLTYNVRGLNTPAKRHKILKELKQYRAEVVFLQEAHLFQETNVKLYSKDFPNWYYRDSTTKRTKGVAIGFVKGTRFTLKDRMTDTEGRYLFLKGRLGEMTCTLANIYCPNRNPIKYLKETMGKLKDFKKGDVILTGDLNFCMDSRLDTTSHVQGTKNVLL